MSTKQMYGIFLLLLKCILWDCFPVGRIAPEELLQDDLDFKKLPHCVVASCLIKYSNDT